MNALTDRESFDIQKVLENKDYFSTMSERHKTAAVSLVAVFASGHNLEYVPDFVVNKDICRIALKSDDVDCTILPLIPFPDVQKEGIKKFSDDTPEFVLYSFSDISDAQMAHDAVKADAYCLQFVPDKLITAKLCKTALQHTETDKKILGFIPERFLDNLEIKKIIEGKFGGNLAQKETSLSEKKKGRSIN